MGAMLRRLAVSPAPGPGVGCEAGSGLIEFMLALLVFSFAMTGLLSVQTLAMQASAEALHRSKAVLLAQDLFARVRGNPGELGGYLGAGMGDERLRRPPPARDCDRVSCTPPELAAFDLWRWESLLLGEAARAGGRDIGGLPVPRACISRDGPRITLGLYWLGGRGVAPGGRVACESADERLYDEPALPPGNQRRRRGLDVWGVVERVRS